MGRQSSTSSSVLASLACCLLIAWCQVGKCQDVEISSVSLPLAATDFPAAIDRLPTPAPLGWRFADTNQHAGVNLSTTTGVLQLVVRHSLPGIPADAVYWLYRNLHKSVQYKPPGVTTSRLVPLFQLLHPVDHLSFKCRTCTPTGNIGPGSSLDWIELQMTMCRVESRTWNCSDPTTGKDMRTGFVNTTPDTLWKKKYLPTKVTSTVTQLSPAGYKALAQVSAQGLTFNASYVAHDFVTATTAQGVRLNVTTTIRVGLLKPDGTFDKDNLLFAPVNGGIKSKILEFTDVKSITWVGRGMLLHSIQEWQNLRTWLQPVYMANKGTMLADA